MTSRRAATGLLSAALCFAACTPRGYVRWEDIDADKHLARADTAKARDAADTVARPSVPAPPAPPIPPPPSVVPPPVAAAVPILIDGASVADGATLDMPALELACLPAPDALTDVAQARARFDAAAKAVNATVGTLSFVVLERDPARSITDPPPHLCKTLVAVASLKAPLVREHEPAARWVIRRISVGLVDDVAALVKSGAALSPVGAPRVIVDAAGALVAVALPVSTGPTGAENAPPPSSAATGGP